MVDLGYCPVVSWATPTPHPTCQMHPCTQRIFRRLLCALEQGTQRTNISKYSGTKLYQMVFHVLKLLTDLYG